MADRFIGLPLGIHSVGLVVWVTSKRAARKFAADLRRAGFVAGVTDSLPPRAGACVRVHGATFELTTFPTIRAAIRPRKAGRRA